MSSSASADPAPAPAIRSVLRRPGVAVTFALNAIGKLPLASVGLLMLIRVSEEYGYAAAGVVDAIFAIGMGVSGAIWGRVIQHVAMTRVLLPLAVLNGAALVGTGLLPSDAPLALFGLAALLVGLSEPPFGGVMRALWDRMLERDDERHVGYALDGSMSEALFTVSPAVLVGGVASVAGPASALVAAGVMVAAAGVAFALVPVVRATPPNAEDQRSTGVLGALRYPGVRTAVGVNVALGMHLGPMEVGLTAFGRDHGGEGTTGVLFAVWAAGSAAAGLWLARIGPAEDPVRRMLALLGWVGVCSTLLALPDAPVLLAIPLVLAGAGVAPVWITLNGSFDRLAPPGAEAEIYNITMAGVMAGVVLGTPLAGVLVDAGGATAGFLLALAGPAAAAALLAARRRDFAQKY